MMKNKFNVNPLPVQIPIGKEDKFTGIIDLVTMKAVIYKDVMGLQYNIEDIPQDSRQLLQNTGMSL